VEKRGWDKNLYIPIPPRQSVDNARTPNVGNSDSTTTSSRRAHGRSDEFENEIDEEDMDDEDEFNSSDIEDICSCKNNLKECGVGYRAPYMRRASEMFTLEMDLSEIFNMGYDEAFETILKVPGVGPKVADCILLYGFNFREAFPSDVWIKRIVSHLYFEGKDISVSKVREFGMDEFGDNAGYVQLYMFHYARKSGLMAKLK
jgi:N-glycosylase/DNA lyase